MSIKTFKLIPADILFLKGDVNYSEIYLSCGGKLVFSKTLLRYEEALPNFLRVSRSYLVNPAFILKIEGLKGDQEIIITTGQRLKVSRRKTVNLSYNQKNNF